jgi:hypothetical protein
MTTIIQLLTTLCITLTFTSNLLAMADRPPKKAPLPDGALDSQQIKQHFSDRTTVATFDNKDKVEVYYFSPDGQVTEIEDGFQRYGSWYVRKDGRLCMQIENEHKDCRMIIKEGEQYQQYAAKLDGNHVYEQTYSRFMAGNQLKAVSPKPILPPGTLNRDEVRALFLDKTVESVTANQGRVSHTYYSPEGKVLQMRNGVQRTGEWRVTKNARICLQMENLGEKCRIIVKEGSTYKKYIVKKNGHHQHSVTYRSFKDGKQF